MGVRLLWQPATVPLVLMYFYCVILLGKQSQSVSLSLSLSLHLLLICTLQWYTRILNIVTLYEKFAIQQPSTGSTYCKRRHFVQLLFSHIVPLFNKLNILSLSLLGDFKAKVGSSRPVRAPGL